MPKSSNQTPDTQVTPEPILEKRTRRTYSAEYKMKIIAQADACKHGEVGALLRREKLYSNQLSAWRSELKNGGVSGLQKTTPGPKPSKTADQRHIEQLEKANAKMARELEIANGCLDLQKKALSMLDHLSSGNNL